MPWSDQKQANKKWHVSYRVIDDRNTTPFAVFKPVKDKPSQPGPVDTSSIVPYSGKIIAPDKNDVKNLVTKGYSITTPAKVGYDRLESQNAKNTFHTKATGGHLNNMRELVKQAPIVYENPMSGNNVVDTLKLEIYQNGNPLKSEDGIVYGIETPSVTIQANLEANVSSFEFIGGNGSYKQLVNSGDYNVTIDFIVTPGSVIPTSLDALDFSGNGKGGSNPIIAEEKTAPQYQELKKIEGLLNKASGALNNAAAWLGYNKSTISNVARTAAAIGTTARQVASGNLSDLNYLQPMSGMVDYDLKPDSELQLLCAMLRFICKYPFAYQLHVTNRYLNQLGIEYLCPTSWRTDTTDDFTNTYRLSLEAHGDEN